MYDHQKQWPSARLAQLNQLYQDFLLKYEEAQYAQSEGVFECTIRSQSTTIQIGIEGFDIAQLVIEAISDKLSKLEGDIEFHQVQFATEVNEAGALAHQAAATATVKRAGRPKKIAVPEHQVMQAVGALAAQVPMNSASKLPGAVVNQPQG